MSFTNDYQLFKEKYQINLNEQQDRAVQAIDGTNLLLAVPGSGKTTVLIARLGYMVIAKKIPPEKILAITYNKDAVKEMKDRFCSKFGRVIGEKINFRTVNSLSFEIYKDYCAKSLRKDIKDLKEGKDYYKIIEEKEKLTLLLNLLKKDNSEYVYENDIHTLDSEITLIKNSINKNQTMNIVNIIPDLNKKIEIYNDKLKKSKLMDYDDQLVFGHAILAKREEFAKYWQSKYKYICVDEAQDLSEIQHEIVKNLAKGNNLFMVGDEDQSIYSFRGAYPKALLNFKNEYTNASIMYMERNYRSTPQIVQKAKEFISQNKNRYEKNMTAEQNEGQEIILINATTRETQYKQLVKIAEDNVDETAFLYRENESAIVLVDLLLRNNIHFKLQESKINFFESKSIKEVICYLKLAINDRDIESFKHICNKGILKIPGNQKDYTIKNLNSKNISVYEALKTQLPYLRSYQKENVYDFCDTMQKVSHSNSFEAISILLRDGYAEYLNNKHLDKDKINILQILAKQEPDIRQFLNRLDELKNLIKDGHNKNQTSSIILSTIHSSKGLEYKNVYLVDVYDGKLPSCGLEDEIVYEEERRMFYVAITRARKGLYLTNIEDKTCSFINELFHKPKKLAQYFNDSYEIHPKIGMVLFHKNYGEIKIVDTKKNGADTIIYVVDSNGEISSKSWNILLLNNQITLL